MAAEEPLYYDFVVPLALHHLLEEVNRTQPSDPNSPDAIQARAPQDWYSQPRPAIVQDTPRATLYVLGDSGTLFDTGQSTINDWGIARLLDPKVWLVKYVPYTNKWPLKQAVAEAQTYLVSLINDTPGKFAFMGTGVGAIIASRLYNEIRHGGMTNRRDDLLAGVSFGSPVREPEHTFPGAPDPGVWHSPTPLSYKAASGFYGYGGGVLGSSYQITSTENLWWDFALPGDHMSTTAGIDPTGHDLQVGVRTIYEQYDGAGDILTWVRTHVDSTQLTGTIDSLVNTLRPIIEAGPNWPHYQYDRVKPIAGDDRTYVQIAAEYINRIGREYYDNYVYRQTTEVLTINFRLPLSVSEIAFEALRVPTNIELWYRDRSGNWNPVRDESYSPVTVRLNYSANISWYKVHFYLYPIVATALQFRLTRVPSTQVGNQPYVVGLRNVLPRRNVYDRASGRQAIEPHRDKVGNQITSYIRDWPGINAIDDDPKTFWKSFPIPDPAGVVCLYLDLRDIYGNAQVMDTLYIDPVYSGQNLCLYYSSDDTVGTLHLSPVSLLPSVAHNTEWTLGTGMIDIAELGTSDSNWQSSVAWGPMVNKPTWIGIEWAPDFNSLTPPPQNCVLFSTTAGTPNAAQWQPTVYYDVGAGYITLSFWNGTTNRNYHVALNQDFTKGTTFRIVVGWVYDPDTVFISIQTQTTDYGTVTLTPGDLPGLVSLDGTVGFSNFRGKLTALVVKQEAWTNGLAGFRSSPRFYVNPDPVQPNQDGTIPSRTLDNAILASDWTSQQFPTGGNHESAFEDKVWTPIWRNYIARKGKLFLPQTISAKYLKLEFTNLTPEPYPVYDSGVQVTYHVYPKRAIQQAAQAQAGGGKGLINALLGTVTGILTLGSEIVSRSFSVNWLNSSTVRAATNTAFGQTTAPIQVLAGPGAVTGSLPNTAQTSITTMYRSEQTSPWIYNRTLPNPSYLAGHKLQTIANSTSNQTLTNPTDRIGLHVAGSFDPNTSTSNSNVLPQRGADWWLLPGANLKMPADVMNTLFGGSNVRTNRYPSTESRIRFPTTSVHRYERRTATLDAAVAYYAGLREVQAYRTSYLGTQDPPTYKFDRYDDITKGGHFTYTRVTQYEEGPLTTSGTPYVVKNPNFALDLAHWDLTGDWYWDGENGIRINDGQSACAAVRADGRRKALVSEPVAVSPGDELVINAWVRFVNALSASPGSTIDNGDGTATITGDDFNPAPASPDNGDGTSNPVNGGNDNGDGTGTLPATNNNDGTASIIDYDGDGTVESGAFDNLDGTAFPITILSNFDGTASIPDAEATDQGDGTAVVVSAAAPDNYDGTAGTADFFGGGELSISGIIYDNDDEIGEVHFGAPLHGHGPSFLNPNGHTDGYIYYQLIGTYSVPLSGVDALAVSLNVNSGVARGTIFYTNVEIDPADGIEGTVVGQFTTKSQFSKLVCNFHDSGLVRSDGMWARMDPLDTNIENIRLAYYVTTIPNRIPAGNWAGDFVEWADTDIVWGEPWVEANITLDPNRMFDGNRVIHFTRVAASGGDPDRPPRAGISVVQQTNLYPDALFRLCAKFYKKKANANQITLQLRRISDGVVVYYVTFDPPVGKWTTYQSIFQEIPLGTDQVYTLEFISTGDDADDIYLSDLWTDIAGVRYFVQLGDVSQPVYDVTALRYGDETQVTSSTPVTWFGFTAGIFSPHAYCYGAELTPAYLQ